MQDPKRDTEVKTRFLNYVGEGKSGTIWENSIETCILPHVKIDDQCKFNAWSRAPKAGALGQPIGMGWGGRWERVSGWWDTCAPMADSCQCMAKTTTIL